MLSRVEHGNLFITSGSDSWKQTESRQSCLSLKNGRKNGGVPIPLNSFFSQCIRLQNNK